MSTNYVLGKLSIYLHSQASCITVNLIGTCNVYVTNRCFLFFKYIPNRVKISPLWRYYLPVNDIVEFSFKHSSTVRARYFWAMYTIHVLKCNLKSASDEWRGTYEEIPPPRVVCTLLIQRGIHFFCEDFCDWGAGFSLAVKRKFLLNGNSKEEEWKYN